MTLFQKNLLIVGYSIITIWAYIAWITYTAHPHYDNVDISTLKEYKATPDTNGLIQYSYLPSDIMRVDYSNMDIYFENGGDPLEFSNITDLKEYVEETTAYTSSIHGYKENFDWLVSQGYVYAKTVHNPDEQYTELIYNGPNWTVNAQVDTNYIITTFNHVEKLTDNKTTWYESYTVD